MYNIVKTKSHGFSQIMDEIRNEYQPGMLCGSAISMFSPTCIEPGMRTTNNLAEMICGSAGIKDSTFSNIIKMSAYEAVLGLYPKERYLPELLSGYFLRYGKENLLSGTPVEPNNSHRAVANLLETGRITGIVTTNYDTCIETAYERLSGKTANVIVKRQARNLPDFRKAIYKIHGCAAKGDMIYRIEQEGTMPKWKQNYLQQVVGDAIIVMGYSGQDFDICPVLASLKFKRMFWIALDNGKGPEITPQAEAVLAKNAHVATVISGDMRDVLSAWSGTDISRDTCHDATLLSDQLVKSLNRSERRLWAARLFGLFGIPAASAAAINKEKAALPEGAELSIDFKEAELSVLSHSGRYYDHIAKSVEMRSKADMPVLKRINLNIGEAGSASMAADYELAKSALVRAEKLCSDLSKRSEILQARISIRWMDLVLAGDEMNLSDDAAVERHFDELNKLRVKAEGGGFHGLADNCRERIATILKRRGIEANNDEGDKSGKIMLQIGINVGYWTAVKTRAERTGSQEDADKLRSELKNMKRYGRYVTLWRVYKLLIHFESDKKMRNSLFKRYKRAMAHCQFHVDYIRAMDREARDAIRRPKFAQYN